ncbi:hypothetical protein K2X33_16700 [bacterium]|nr:hypothetical protein [bacterium]
MSTQNQTAQAPFWLVPKSIRREANDGLLMEWIHEEQAYCSRKLALSAFFSAIAFAFCIYLDINYDPPASLEYALRGRGLIAAIFFTAAMILRWKPPQKWISAFMFQKLSFGIAVMAAVAYQFQYSEDYLNRARYLPPMIFVLGMYAGRVGPSFTALFSLVYAGVATYFNIHHPGHFQEDLNHFTIAVVGVFLFQNRIFYEARHFVSEWRERTRLATAEREAKILASHAYKELTKLVYPHVVDQIQSGRQIEQTMPSGSSRAAVLCLDVIDSSRIIHEEFPGAMERFQGAMYELMSRGYDAKTLTGTGYRVKDVGDGVYYSLGFPFTTPRGQRTCDLAVTLAGETIEAFHSIMGKLDYPKPITCGVGIAYEAIEGFFPSQGLCQYDLRGRAIILANRYQSFRKQLGDLGLFQEGSSSLIISQQVYANLSPPLRAQFKELRMNDSLRVRNDQDANAIYYQVFRATALKSAA